MTCYVMSNMSWSARAYLYKISSKSDYISLKYDAITISKMAFVRHFEFSVWNLWRVNMIVDGHCLSVQKFAKMGYSAAELWPKTALHLSAIFNLKVVSFGRRIFVIVLIIALICIVFTKFHQNLMIFHWDMAILRFSSLRSSAVLYFQSLTQPNQRLVVINKMQPVLSIVCTCKTSTVTRPRTGIQYRPTDPCNFPPGPESRL